MEESKLDIEELLDECIEIYDYNMSALGIHVFELSKQIGRTTSNARILKDIENRHTLEKYRSLFIKVMDSFKTEIEKYKLITNFNIAGIHGGLIYCHNNKERLDVLNVSQRLKLKRELVDIQYYTERLLKEIE